MDEIPDDIQQAATRFAGEYLAHDISCERLYRDVAALLVAERERCANVVEGIGNVGRDWALTSFMGSLRRDIAAAVRSTPLASEGGTLGSKAALDHEGDDRKDDSR